MEPRFEEKGAFAIVGLELTATYPEMTKVPEVWSQLIPRSDEVKWIDTWGVCWDRQDDFTYVAAYEVCDPSNVPAGMVSREIPANRYVVFTHQGKLSNLRATFDYAYKTWLPQSGHERNYAAPFLELYDERYKGEESDDTIFEIWLPIK